MTTSKQPGKTSLLAANLAFTTAQTVHTFDLKSLTPTVTVVEKETTDKEEEKPPLDLAQRGGSLVSLLAEQRREQQPTSGLDPQEEPASRQTIMVTSAHNFPAFSAQQPTYLVSLKCSKFLTMMNIPTSQMTGYYRGQDGQEYVETEHEVETEKIYKL